MPSAHNRNVSVSFWSGVRFTGRFRSGINAECDDHRRRQQLIRSLYETRRVRDTYCVPVILYYTVLPAVGVGVGGINHRYNERSGPLVGTQSGHNGAIVIIVVLYVVARGSYVVKLSQPRYTSFHYFFLPIFVF